MAKLQDLATVATEIARDTDFLYGIRSQGGSPETFQDIKVPANVLDIGTIYDFGMSFSGTPDTALTLGRAVVGSDIVIPVNFARSFGWVTTNPAASFEILLQKQTSGSPALETVGTITISTAGAFSFVAAGASPPADIEIAAGTRMHFVYEAGGGSPLTPDASIFDIDIVIGARVR